MKKMTFEELVRDLRQRREIGDRPPVVVLGAGASIESGIGTMADLFAFVGCKNFTRFYDYINPLTAGERYRLLGRFLQSQEPSQPTPGYRSFAALCAEAYFDLILTTNLDPLLEDALAEARLWRRDYLLIANGIIRPERFELLLLAGNPRVKIVKLHGDLFHRFMAWTPKEMNAFLDDILPPLRYAVHGRDMLVVGHSLRDERIRELVLGAGGIIYYVSPHTLPDFLDKNENTRAVINPKFSFEWTFTELAKGLGTTFAKAPTGFRQVGTPLLTGLPPGAQTLDDFAGSVVAITDAQGVPRMTGFILAEPRVIITDRYSGERISIQDNATIMAADQRRFSVKVKRWIKSHPFGPLVLSVPADLKIPGLQVDSTQLPPDMEVRVGVAVGERVGISSGLIPEPVEQSISIAPVGLVGQMIGIDCVVAPGACGAPVVDREMRVRGFIVAGSKIGPPSFMYPASRWAPALAESRAACKSSAAHGAKRRK